MRKPFDPELDALEAQQALPRLESLERVKSGGEGAVFKAWHPDLKRVVAVKIYDPLRVMRRAELEVEKASQINCPHLAAYFDSGICQIRGDDCYFIISEFIEGTVLGELLATEPRLSEDEIKDMVIQIGSAIEALWAANVVHCDVTPNNVIRRRTGEFVLIDLGIAKHLDAEQLTQHGMFFGTHGYMAPEQLKGRKNLTLRADFYSLGIIAYEAVLGVHPFYRRQDLMFNTPVPPLPYNLSVAPSLRKMLEALTEQQAYKRPKSVQEILNLVGGNSSVSL